MEEALFRNTITSTNFLQDWFGLRFCLAIQKLKVEARQGIITLLELHFCQRHCKTLEQHNNIKYFKSTELYKMFLKVWKIIFLCCYPSVLIQFCGSSFACNWMLDHDESFLVSSVVFGADMWTTN